MCGEIGGSDEEDAAAYAADDDQAGRRLHLRPHRARRASAWATPAPSSPATPAPPRAKSTALQAAGVPVADTIFDIPGLTKQALARVNGA